MLYAVISDVHANLTALKCVIADAKENGAEAFVCLGDVVGYGPQPSEALDLVRETCVATVAGNHDDAVSGRGDSSSFVDLAKDAVERHRAALSQEQLGWLSSLPHACHVGDALLVHGDAFDPPKFYYVEDTDDAAANFAKTSEQLVFVGHTHEPGIFLTGRSGTVYKTAAQDFTIEPEKRYIVNPGSVGYPREADGQCLSSYVLYDSDEGTVSFRFVPFLVESVMQRGKASAPLRKRVTAAVAVAAAAAAALAVWLVLPRSVEVVEDPALVVESRELPLDSDMRSVSANLTLAGGSCPVQVKVVFLTANGEVSGVESLTVKQSSRRRIRIPKGSSTARFTVEKSRRGDVAEITGFAPSASVK